MGKNRILDYWFMLSRSEKRGSVVLVALLFVALLVRITIPYISSNNDSYLEEINKKIALLEHQRDSLLSISLKTGQALMQSGSEDKNRGIEQSQTFEFDPNTVSFTSLLNLGFSKKVAQTLLNYRDKGGRFFKSDDLYKIYGVDSALIEKLEAYIKIGDSETKVEPLADKADVKAKVIKLELNSADSVALIKLPGIGPVYAGRICKFRNYLGGFYSAEQLKEVYGMPLATFSGIENLVWVDNGSIRQININWADKSELKAHPYCSYSVAVAIVDYRTAHGLYKSVSDLKNMHVLSDSLYTRLMPYLCIE